MRFNTMKQSCQAITVFRMLFLLSLPIGIAVAAPSIPLGQLGAEADKKVSSQTVTVTAEGLKLSAPMQRLEAYVNPRGAIIRSVSQTEGRGDFSINPVMVGRKSNPAAVPGIGTVSSQDAHSVMLDRNSVVEQFSASADGIRQDFIIPQKPMGKGSLALFLSVNGAKAAAENGGISLTIPTWRKFVYGNLKATDVSGKPLVAKMEAKNTRQLMITVEDANARYPVTIDPTITDADWSAMNKEGFLGANNQVSALACGKNGSLYLAGMFSVAGNVWANKIARWDGSAWSALGSAVKYDTGVVCALAVDSSGVLYAGGSFSDVGGVAARNIAKWYGSAWSPLGTGTRGKINALLIDKSGNLFAGGLFDSAGSILAKDIAKWDGKKWDALDSGITSGGSIVNALACDTGGNIYVGGNFSSAGGVVARNIARWSGSGWSAVGSLQITQNQSIFTLACDTKGNLFAAGAFESVVKWDGSQWVGTGLSLNSYGPVVYAITVDNNGNLFAGACSYNPPGACDRYTLTKWDGKVWSELGEADWPIKALAQDGAGNVYAGGNFTIAGDMWADRVIKWNGKWSTLGLGMGGINAIAADSSGNLYVGGKFDAINGVAAHKIAKWDGSAWGPLGSGISGGMKAVGQGLGKNAVYALAVDRTGNLYAGGNFTLAGGVPASCVAKWDGTKWNALGSGIDIDNYVYNYTPWSQQIQYYSTVYALALDRKGNLYAGGDFTAAGGASASKIAKWDGTAWSPLTRDSTTSIGNVFEMAVDTSGNLFTKGTSIDRYNQTYKGLIKWNGTTWTFLTEIYYLYALAGDGKGNLYVGGQFGDINGYHMNNIARWDGKSWSPLDKGLNATVYAIIADGLGNVFAGGYFDSASGISANCIAQWNGSAWSALGSGLYSFGIPSPVGAFAVYGSTLFASGYFITAGGKMSPYLAKVNTTGSGTPANPESGLLCPSNSIHYRFEKSTLLLSNTNKTDRISLYSLSGRCIREVVGISRIKLSNIAPQPLIVRVNREGKIVSTGMVMAQ
jgi:hypothetical protein